MIDERMSLRDDGRKTDGVHALLVQLNDPATFGTARDVLVAMGESAVHDVVCAFEQSKTREDTENTAGVLRRMGSVAVGPIIASILDHPDLPLLHHASILGDIGDPRGVEALSELTRNRSWITRCFAIEALAKIGGASVAPAIAARLRDRAPSVVFAAARGIAEVGRASDLPELRRILAKPSLWNSPGTAVAIQSAIERITEREGLPKPGT